jgi:hypothetical protein
MNPEPDRLYSGQGSGLDFFFPILQEVEGFASGHPNGSMLFSGVSLSEDGESSYAG